MPKNHELPGNDVFGQYAFDAMSAPGDPRLLADPYGIKAMRGDGNLGFHGDSTLFDQGHDVIDEATGRPFMAIPTLETEALGLEGMTVRDVDESIPDTDDTAKVGDVAEADDIAEAWLKKHGYTW